MLSLTGHFIINTYLVFPLTGHFSRNTYLVLPCTCSFKACNPAWWCHEGGVSDKMASEDKSIRVFEWHIKRTSLHYSPRDDSLMKGLVITQWAEWGGLQKDKRKAMQCMRTAGLMQITFNDSINKVVAYAQISDSPCQSLSLLCPRSVDCTFFF